MWLYTLQKVIKSHRDHMWSSPHAIQASSIPSKAHPHHHRVISSGKLWIKTEVCQVTMDPRQKTSQNLTVLTIQTFDQLWWVLHCLSVLPGEKS